MTDETEKPRDEAAEEPDLSDERFKAEREVRNEGEDEDERNRPGVMDEVTSAAEEEAERLQQGPKLPFFAGPLPVRALLAMLIFIAVFVVVWLLLWTALGTLGIAIGWIAGAAAGLVAMKLASDRLGEGERGRRDEVRAEHRPPPAGARGVERARQDSNL